MSHRPKLSEPVYWCVLVLLIGAMMFSVSGQMEKFGSSLTLSLILLHLREKLE